MAHLLPLWQQRLGRSQSTIATVFFRTGRLPHWVDAKGRTAGAGPGLSQRQWDSVNQQALGAFRSWLGNCERVFAGCVARSTLPEQTKLDLFYLNKANAWYLPGVDADGAVLDQVALSSTKSVSTATLALARQIMRHVRSRVGQPDLCRTRTMVMYGKVANVAASKVPSADYRVRVSTAIAGKPVHIPLRSQVAFSARLAMPGAVVANHCQVIVSSPDKHGTIRVDLPGSRSRPRKPRNEHRGAASGSTGACPPCSPPATAGSWDRTSVLLRLDERFQSRWGLSFAEAEQRHSNKPAPRVVLASATTATQGNEFPLAT